MPMAVMLPDRLAGPLRARASALNMSVDVLAAKLLEQVLQEGEPRKGEAVGASSFDEGDTSSIEEVVAAIVAMPPDSAQFQPATKRI